MPTLNTIWYANPKYKMGKLLDTHHGKVLQSMVIRKNERCIDLGCGDQGAKVLFTDYTGVDLPKFDVYNTDLDFINDYNIVLLNAFIDVMEFPLKVLDDVLFNSSKYVIIHRQEFTYGPTEITQEPAYGGLTWHSKINWWDFYKVIKGRFYVIDYRRLDFDNWEQGGVSLILKKY